MKKEMRELEFGEELSKIITTYKDGSDEALDGDEVDALVEHLRNAINLIEGNITQKEYETLEVAASYSLAEIDFNFDFSGDDQKVKSQYADFSKTKRYAYDIYKVKLNRDEEFVDRYVEISLTDLALLLAGKNKFELSQHYQFEDWYVLHIEDCKYYYRIQLFQ